MSQVDVFRQQQSDFWNGPMGARWVETQEITDEMLAPAGDVLVDEAKTQGASAVLDIGCGNGTTTLAIAQALGDEAKVTGIDLSELMMDHAQGLSREADSRAEFIAADAAAYDYVEGHYDLLVSRFGCMFFADQIAALRRLRIATADNGRLCFVTWQSPDANPFLTAGARAAAPLLPEVPPHDPDAPSPFAMADPASVTANLTESGWTDVSFKEAEFNFSFPARHLEVFIRALAPIGPGLDQMGEKTREAIFDAVRPAFQDYVTEDRLAYRAACWIIRARAAPA